MQFFSYKDNELHVENMAIEKLAQQYGTPMYVYSMNSLIEKVKAYQQAFADVKHTIFYAQKANENINILKLMASLGCGADIVSGGELFLALKAGIPANRIVYASVGKTDAEIEQALNAGICAFNVESPQELEVINEMAIKMDKQAPVAIRINPNIDIHGHPYISTGKSMNKFGIDYDDSLALIRHAANLDGIKIVGIHSHIGSQILNVEYFAAAAQKFLQMVRSLQKSGIKVEHVDMGGGLGVNYKSIIPEYAEDSLVIPTPVDLAKKVKHVLKPLDCEIYFEPGRSIVGEAGALITKVLYRKETNVKKFIVVDAGMSDLIRPSLYQAYHQIVPLQKIEGDLEKVDVVGPICETGDFLAQNRNMPEVQRGDFLAVMTAGAYGFSLANNYNARPRPVEVWVDGDKAEIIRERENVERFLE
ncbi:diaminopimelate decarboxylase [candidate division KSB1 bacterium]|nr:diaminopimelate decarboxylase [candidate division KSB1 bacterium]